MRDHSRRNIFISTKACLAWDNGRVFRNGTRRQIKKILDETIKDPVGPEFMAPPKRVPQETPG